MRLEHNRTGRQRDPEALEECFESDGRQHAQAEADERGHQADNGRLPEYRRNTCRRLAPTMRKSASSLVRCPTMMENVLRMVKPPTKSEMKAKTSSPC